MALLRQMLPLERRIQTLVVGPLSFEDIEAHVSALQDAQALGYAELIEANPLHGPRLSYSDLWAAAQLVKDATTFQHPGRRAIVVTGAADFLLARLFIALVHGWVPVRAFRNRRAAEKWLAVPVPADVM